MLIYLFIWLAMAAVLNRPGYYQRQKEEKEPLEGEFRILRFHLRRFFRSKIEKIKLFGTPEKIIHEYVDWAQSQPEVPYQSYTTASRVMKQTEVVRTVK